MQALFQRPGGFASVAQAARHRASVRESDEDRRADGAQATILRVHDGALVRKVVGLHDSTIVVVGQSKHISVFDDSLSMTPKRVIKHAHSTSILTAARKEGSIVATGSGDKSIKVFDVNSDKPLKWHVPDAHAQGVTHLEWSPCGNFLVSIGEERSVKVWHYPNTQCVHEWTEVHEGAITGVAFHPKSKHGHSFVTVGRDRCIKVFRVNVDEHAHQRIECVSRPKVKTEAHDDWITAVVTSPNPHEPGYLCDESGDNQLRYRFITASWDRSIKIWDWETLDCICELASAHISYPIALCHLGQSFVSVGANNTIKIWNDQSQQCQHVIHHAHSSTISALTPYRTKGDMPTAVSCFLTAGTNLKLWSARCSVPSVDVWDPSSRTVRGVALDRAEDRGVFVFAKTDYLRIYTHGDYSRSYQPRAHMPARVVKAANDKDDADDREPHNLMLTVKAATRASMFAHKLSHKLKDGPAVVEVPKRVYFPNKSPQSENRKTAPEYFVRALCSCHGTLLISVSVKSEEKIEFVSSTTTNENSEMTYTRPSILMGAIVRGICVLGDFKRFVTCSDDLALSLWAVEAPEDGSKQTPLAVKELAHEDRIVGVACNASGSRVVSCGVDRAIKVWQLEGNNFGLLHTIVINRTPNALSFSPLNNSFAVTDRDRTIAIYEADGAYRQVGLVEDCQQRLMSAAYVEFSFSGQALFSVDQFGGMRRWPLNLSPVVCHTVYPRYERARSNQLRNLSAMVRRSDSANVGAFVEELLAGTETHHGEIINSGNFAVVPSLSDRDLKPIPSVLAVSVPDINPAVKTSSCSHICMGPGAFLPKFFSEHREFTSEQWLVLLTVCFPWLLTSPCVGGRPLLHHAVAGKDVSLLSIVLNVLHHTVPYYVLPSDEGGLDVLNFSIDVLADDMTKLLLDYVARSQGVQPLGTQITSLHLRKLLDWRPAMVAPFLHELGLARVPSFTVGDVREVHMEPDVVIRGSEEIDTPGLWPEWLAGRNTNEEEDMAKLKKYPVEAGVIAIANICRDRALMRSIVQSKYCEKLLFTDVISHVLSYKWQQFGRSMYVYEAKLYLVYLFLFCAFLVTAVNNRGTKDPVATAFMAVFGLLSPLMTLRLMYREYRQFRRAESTRAYLSDSWNQIDLVLLVLGFVSPFLLLFWCFFSSALVFAEEVAAVAVALLWMKLLFFGRAFKAFGALIRMLFEILEGMVTFLAVLVVTMIGFGLSFFTLFHDVEDSGFNSLFDTVLSCYTMMLGEMDLDTYKQNTVAVLLFAMYMFIVFLIMLNVVIAIIGDTYDQVVQEQDIKFKKELASIFVEMEEFITFTESDNTKRSDWDLWGKSLDLFLSRATAPRAAMLPSWLHILSPQVGKEEEEGEWSGRVHAIITAVEAQMVSLEARMVHAHKQLAEQVALEMSRGAGLAAAPPGGSVHRRSRVLGRGGGSMLQLASLQPQDNEPQDDE